MQDVEQAIEYLTDLSRQVKLRLDRVMVPAGEPPVAAVDTRLRDVGAPACQLALRVDKQRSLLQEPIETLREVLDRLQV